MIWNAITESPLFMYLKIGALAVAIAGAGYVAWSVRGAYAEREKTEAVNAAVASMQKQLDDEQKLRAKYETIADARIEALVKSISKLQGTFGEIATSIAKERASNPEFYTQPLPAGGLEQWKKAREQVRASNTEPAQP